MGLGIARNGSINPLCRQYSAALFPVVIYHVTLFMTPKQHIKTLKTKKTQKRKLQMSALADCATTHARIIAFYLIVQNEDSFSSE